MILQALNEFYDRVSDQSDIPQPGFSSEKIHFALVLNSDGDIVQVRDLRETKGKRLIPKELFVPARVKKSVNIAANFMWGDTGYVLGYDNKGKPKRAFDTFSAFKKLHYEIGDNIHDDGMIAILKFLNSWDPQQAQTLEHWEEMAGLNIVFQLDGERRYLHQRPIIRDIWLSHCQSKSSATVAACIVYGNRRPIARLHPNIKGVRGAQSSGAALVSFNLDSFSSYGKEQNFNAPVSEKAAFAYTTALNYLLRSDSPQKVQIGETTTVFWTERESRMIEIMGTVLETKSDSDVKEISDFLNAMRSGKKPEDIDLDDRFFILGLSPNASRLSVRFWHVSTVGEMSKRITQHFDDLSICKSFDNDPEFPGMWQLLIETAAQRKSENISPVLAGALMRSILTGAAYPQSLLSAIIGRIRADQKVNYIRASIIKACLNRKWRINNNEMEVAMVLNKEETNTAYRLGRLFAALEKVQQDAIPGANATIKDRYGGSASATPRIVFPQLLRLSQHHIQKAEYGKTTDKIMEGILQGIDAFPAHLSLDDQGLFWLGYYHQRRDFFTKKDNKED
jgi:CRISPR-associated protein Csd1